MSEDERRTVRKSRRFAAKRRAAKEKGKRMSVGAAMGLTPRTKRTKGRNLAETKALASAMAATRKRRQENKRQPAAAEGAKAKSPPRERKPASSRKTKAPSKKHKKRRKSHRRSSMARSSIAMRAMTEQLFDDEESEESESYLDDMPPLSDSEPLRDDSGSEGKDEGYEDRMQKARKRSIIETPHSQRAKRRPSDDDFIVSDDDEPSINLTSDEDYVPTEEEGADFDALGLGGVTKPRGGR